MTWTFTVDEQTVRITDTQLITVQEQLDRVGAVGAHFDFVADDGTELKIDSNSRVTLTHDG